MLHYTAKHTSPGLLVQFERKRWATFGKACGFMAFGGYVCFSLARQMGVGAVAAYVFDAGVLLLLLIFGLMAFLGGMVALDAATTHTFLFMKTGIERRSFFFGLPVRRRLYSSDEIYKFGVGGFRDSGRVSVLRFEVGGKRVRIAEVESDADGHAFVEYLHGEGYEYSAEREHSTASVGVRLVNGL